MLNLSPTMYNRCRDLLLRCTELESYENLRAVFITEELKPFRYGLKKADSPAELVDLFFDYILDQNLTGGKPAFPAFLAMLLTRYADGDDRRDELTKLLAEFQAQEPAAPMAASVPALQHQLLHEKLMTLDFQPQVKQFRKVIEKNRIAAFLVHGPRKHGQRFLTRRLIQFRPEWGIGQRIVVDAGSNGIGKDEEDLWGQVARQMNEPYKTDKHKLAEKVCEWWKTQDVIFVFLTVDYIPPDLLAKWIDEFWKPIATAAREKENLTQRNTHLLLFLVDFDGHVCETTVNLLDQPEQMPGSHAPLKLPPTAKFPEPDLDYWIGSAAEVLPSDVDAADLIAETNDGVPELVYRRIYERCNLPWEGDKLP
jgi:hypothetical protein